MNKSESLQFANEQVKHLYYGVDRSELELTDSQALLLASIIAEAKGKRRLVGAFVFIGAMLALALVCLIFADYSAVSNGTFLAVAGL